MEPSKDTFSLSSFSILDIQEIINLYLPMNHEKTGSLKFGKIMPHGVAIRVSVPDDDNEESQDEQEDEWFINNGNKATVYSNSKYTSYVGDNNTHHGVVTENRDQSYARRDIGKGRQGAQRHWNQNQSVESPRYISKEIFLLKDRTKLRREPCDERDPFTGNLVGLVKMKKEVVTQTYFHDLVRESFEAELERVQKMQEMERGRGIVEEEERRRRMEEEAREGVWRAEQERLEAIQKAEELKISREEEKNRLLFEEERRKQAAKQMAMWGAEVRKSGTSVHAATHEEVPVGGKGSDASMDSDLDNWVINQRMFERITTSASSESSAIERPFDRPQYSREVSSSFVNRRNPTNPWKRDTLEVGSFSLVSIAMVSVILQTASALLSRDKKEEEICVSKLPADVGSENGEAVIDERKIRKKTLPNVKKTIPKPPRASLDVLVGDQGLPRRYSDDRNSSYLETYLDPAFMSIIKDPDQRRHEKWEKTARAQNGINFAKLLGFGDLRGATLSAAEEYSLHSRLYFRYRGGGVVLFKGNLCGSAAMRYEKIDKRLHIGSFAAITRFLNIVPNHESLLKIAAAGPLAGYSLGLILLLLGFYLAPSDGIGIIVDASVFHESFLASGIMMGMRCSLGMFGQVLKKLPRRHEMWLPLDNTKTGRLHLAIKVIEGVDILFEPPSDVDASMTEFQNENGSVKAPVVANQSSLHKTKNLMDTILGAANNMQQTIETVIQGFLKIQTLLQPYDIQTYDLLNQITYQIRKEIVSTQSFVKEAKHASTRAMKAVHIANLVFVMINLAVLIAGCVVLLLHWHPGFIMSGAPYKAAESAISQHALMLLHHSQTQATETDIHALSKLTIALDKKVMRLRPKQYMLPLINISTNMFKRMYDYFLFEIVAWHFNVTSSVSIFDTDKGRKLGYDMLYLAAICQNRLVEMVEVDYSLKKIENLIFNQVRHTKVMTRALEMIPLAPSSSGMHVSRAVFVDLEPTDIDEVENRRIRIFAFRMLVRGLRENAQTWLQYLSVSTGVNFNYRAIQQCAIKSFPIKTYYCLAETRADIRNSENEIHVVGLFLQRRVFSHGRLYVVVSRVKSKKGLKDVMTPLIEPLSSKSLTGEASTSAAPITTLSTTFASSAIVPPSSVVNDQVFGAEPHNEDPPVVTFEKEELSTSSG
ncbi:hypothetical protein Tco_0084958 [Tanacetum coccineum]